MNKHGLTRDNLLQAIPDVLKNDKGMLALATLLADRAAGLAEAPDKTKIYADLASQNEDVLDTLAKDFKIDWYDYNYALATKRAVVRDSFYIHNHLGTKGSVVSAISDVFPQSLVQEWWEYAGHPFYFRVIIDVTNTIEPAPIGLIKKKIDFYKPARSHLQDDNIIVRISCGIALHTSAGGIGYSVPRAGTIPAVSTQGGIDDSLLSATALAAGSLYHVPKCGTALNALM